MKHFPVSELIDRFEVEAATQRFSLYPGRASRRTLLVPRETIENPALASLLTVRLVDAMKRARAQPVTLTAKGIRH